MYGELLLLTAPGCHMCAHARQTLDELGLPWREISEQTEDGVALAASAPPLRPVLFDGSGAIVAYGRLSGRRLRRDLERGRLHRIGASRSPVVHR